MQIWMSRLLGVTIFLASLPLYSTILMLQSFKEEEGHLKFQFLHALKQHFKKDIFFETGTYAGETTKVACLIFDKVYSSELSKRIYKETKKNLQTFKSKRVKRNHRTHLRLYQGHSPAILKKTLPKISKDILFWLDAHYCGVGTGRGSSDSPILEELEVIKKNNKSNSVIMIDDLRGFYSENWPSLASVITLLKMINSEYTIIAFGDALIAYPASSSIIVSNCLKACSISRFFDIGVFDYSIDDVLNAEEIIGNTNGTELDALCAIFAYGNDKGSDDQYPLLWRALIYERHGDYKSAYELLEGLVTASNSRGINHWRINWYFARVAFKLGYSDVAKRELEIIVNNSDFKEASNLLEIINC